MTGTEPGGPIDARDGTVRSRMVVPDAALLALLGSSDESLRTAEDALTADVHVRGNELTLTGLPADVAFAERVFTELITLAERGQQVTGDAVRRTVEMLSDEGADDRERLGESPAEVLSLDILSRRGKTIRPKTLNQKRYVDSIDSNTIVFGVGPAGTGKTYLAMAKAVQALQAKTVNRIILTRPAVEAGERLGYLPGTLYEKIDPYLRPLYDALHDMLDPDSIPKLMAAGTIEVAPLAYMRGRAQPVDTPVLTPDGFRRIGSLRVGDMVTGSDGRPTPVLGVHPQGNKEVFRLTTQDGASTLACGEHLWHVRTPDDRRRGKDGRVLQTRDMLGKLRWSHAHRYELPLVGAVQSPEQDVPMDPYALGLLLGDGCLTTTTTPAFATKDPELAEALDAALPDIELIRRTEVDYVLRRVGGGGRGGVITANPVTAILRDLGLAGTRSDTKFVPAGYLNNSAEVRLAVLQGLLDSDGGPVRQRGRTCRIQYTSCSDRLRDDVMYLVRSLGGVAYARTRTAEGRRPGLAKGRPVHNRSDAHVLDIRLPAGLAPFRLTRKATAYDADGGGRPMRFVESIEPAGEADCVCISVAAADSLYVTEDFIVTHNTLNDAFIILDEAQNTTPEQMKMFLTRLGFGSRIVVTGDVTQIDLPGHAKSGLQVVREILDGVDDVHFATLDSADVVRHRLVGDIVDAYARWDAAGERRAAMSAGNTAPRNGPPQTRQAGRRR
ncbi:phosphate starvation-inducible PhoH-like protein [Pseudonocardia sediminis]|uniref:PhoH-like protein n=1 Tax=Pseudonocardia sediminis TaxID=1397368 RepID=A0A4Q7V4R0_PSEST|nr:phosphate starvation-inducible PhoH-like protein [Pseudonocardia sediminis]